MTAMPSTDPICRVLEITPEACPAFSGATDPMTAEVMGGITMPMPKPDTANGRMKLGQSVVRLHGPHGEEEAQRGHEHAR